LRPNSFRHAPSARWTASKTRPLAAAAQNLLADAEDSQIPALAEELPSYLRSRNVPSGWLTTALSSRIPGLSDAQAAETLSARQAAVLAANHQNLTRAIEKDTSPPPLLDPYAVNADAYTGGEAHMGGE
jgi:hypothetical protein